MMRDKRSASEPAARTSFGFLFAGPSFMVDGKFESAEIGVFCRHLDRAAVCVDIGANVGLYTCIAASRDKQVVTVEPMARNLDVLYRNIDANGFQNVEVFPLGLSCESGVKRIYGSGTCASLVEGWAGATANSYTLIAVSTLDHVLNGRFDNVPLLIKIDVEGFELQVLQGAKHILEMNPKPTWLVEIALNEHFPGGRNDRFSETFEVFFSHGYEARIADEEERRVLRSDVQSWAREGHVSFGSHNYLFCGKGSRPEDHMESPPRKL
jgi:FkbM family methyltransferase